MRVKMLIDSIDYSYNKVVLDPNFQQAFRSKVVSVVAPASSVSQEVLMKIKSMPGLRCNVPDNLLEKKISYHANDDDERFLQLKMALYDESVDVIIWTLRGGYGSARLIERLLPLKRPLREKTFIGFSDNTALHLFLSQHWGWHTIHGSGFSQLLDLKQDPENYIRLAELIDNQVDHQLISELHPLNDVASESRHIEGDMQGGNLTLVECSIGTPWQMKSEGKILFLEEVNEKGYRIDRSLYHLREAGLIKGASAVVFGDCIGPDGGDIHFALRRFAEDIKIPVFQTNQFGHGDKNYPIVYQSRAEILTIGQDIMLKIQLRR